jgi:hypothetical protein
MVSAMDFTTQLVKVLLAALPYLPGANHCRRRLADIAWQRPAFARSTAAALCRAGLIARNFIL